MTTEHKRLDKLMPNVVRWIPYGDHHAFKEFELISLFSGHVRWGSSTAKHLPKRVVWQFGYVQTIPPLPTAPSLSTEETVDKWLQFFRIPCTSWTNL